MPEVEIAYAKQGSDRVIKLYNADKKLVKEVRPAYFAFRDTCDMLAGWELRSPAHLEYHFINPTLPFALRHELRVDVAEIQLCNDIMRVWSYELGGFARFNEWFNSIMTTEEAEEAFIELRESVDYDEDARELAGAVYGY